MLVQFTSMILSNVEISPGYWRMRLTAPQEFSAATPGQFIMVRVSGAIDPLLRRPFAIFDVGVYTPPQSGSVAQVYFEMLYRVVGKGTALLSTLHQTDLLDILGPLGTGFDQGDPGEEKLLVGGGIGLAPLYLLARELTAKQSPVRLFAGGRSRDDILCITEFKRLGVECYTATEDGSLEKGAPRHPIVEDDVVIYAGATVLGRITIGRGSSIGGNVWLTRSVPPGSHITQASLQHAESGKPGRAP